MTSILQASTIMLITFLQESDTNFNDLGTLLLVGVAAAIVLAVVFSFIRLKLRDKNPPKSSFITIGATDKKD